MALRGLHLMALSALALGEPLFSLLAMNGEFLVAHAVRPAELILLAIVVTLVPSMLILGVEVIAARLGSRARDGIQLVAVTVFASLFFSQALKLLGELPVVPHLCLAAGLGLVATLAYARSVSFRLFLSVVSAVALVCPLLFLFRSARMGLLGFGPGGGTVPSHVRNPVPVVALVFDELPLTSLLDERGEIDAELFPHFAELARSATWFRNATTVAVSTPHAVAAIVTGRYPKAGQLPTAADHPENLFTLLGGSHRVQVRSALTQLCPETVCARKGIAVGARLALLLSDLGVLYLHVVSPPALANRLPSIAERWMGFAVTSEAATGTTGDGVWAALQAGLFVDRVAEFREFVGALGSGSQPGLYFLHTLLPHGPYRFLPSCVAYAADDSVTGLDDGKYVPDTWLTVTEYQRHLLQLGCVDTLVGEVIARLREVGLFDTALLIVTADHGVSFRPGGSRRSLSPGNETDILPVPLFVKAPNQEHGITVDANVETVDIVPTVAHLLGVGLPWSVDGTPAIGRTAPERVAKRVVGDDGEGIFYPRAVPGLDKAVGRKAAHFGAGWAHLYRAAPSHAELIGQPVDAGAVALEEEIELDLDNAGLFTNVDPTSGFVPALVTGRVRQASGRTSEVHVAVAVNATVRAVTRPWSFDVGGVRGRWAAVIDPTAFRPGRNRIDVFTVRGAENGAASLRRASHRSYRLASSGEEILCADGRRIPIRDVAVRGAAAAALGERHIGIWGWVVDQRKREAADWVVIFRDGAFLDASRVDLQRADIGEWLGDSAAHSGFSMRIPSVSVAGIAEGDVRVFGISKDGFASELEYVPGVLWPHER